MMNAALVAFDALSGIAIIAILVHALWKSLDWPRGPK